MCWTEGYLSKKSFWIKKLDVFDIFYGTLRHVFGIDPDLSGFDILYLYPNCLFFLILALMRTHEIFPGPFQDRKWSLLRRKLVKSATQRLGQNSKIDFYSCKNKQCFGIRFAQENSALKINLFKFEIFWLRELTILSRKSHFEMTLWIENDKIDSKMTI